MTPPPVAAMPVGFVPPVAPRAEAPRAEIPRIVQPRAAQPHVQPQPHAQPQPQAPAQPQTPAQPQPQVVAPPQVSASAPTVQVNPSTAPVAPTMALTPPPGYVPPGVPMLPPPAPMLPPPMLPAPQVAAPQLSRHSNRRTYAMAAAVVGVLGVSIAIAATRGGGVTAKDAIVRVTTPTSSGAGFFIAGPDQYAYVATANHVVDRGERVLVERDVGADKAAFVEAYPETEIVATDPDADIAIIRIKNVDASRFSHLTLAKKPTKDEKILSYGYPGSSLATHPGLVSKDGKVLSLVSFPAYDDRYARVLRDNAVDGLLISTDIEPGMSGGPTLNESGEVVGINVTKDRAHVGQNGAVSVVALRDLLAKVKPASSRIEPKPEDVTALLDKIQTEYLLLPVDERSKVRETEFVHAGDLPSLRELVGEVRREERNTDTSFIAKYQLSGQAALGMFFARMPGKLLETYRAPSTVTPLVACELSHQRLTSFLGDLTASDTPDAGLDTCDELAVRPLAWDLVAATLQWDGTEKKYTVTKLDKMDDEGKVYRASLRISGAANLVELWFGVDQNHVRLKLFDAGNNLYAIKSPRTVPASAFQGTWTMKRPRVTDTVNKDAEIEASDTVSISISDGNKVAIRDVVTEKYFAAASSKGGAFRCSGKRTIETGLVQSFTGVLDNGVILAFPDKDAEDVGGDAGYCKPEHKRDRIVAVKLEGDQVTLIRTDGYAYPETVQLTRDVATPAASSGT
jgi:S1-C subfamily serine protease